MKNLTKTLLAIYIAIMCVAVACKKDEPTPTPTTPPVVTTKSAAKDITKFSFAALSPVVDATIDATNKTISATVPAATDLTKLVPTITVSDKATVSPATGVAQDFSKDVSYTVTAEDGSTAVWKVGVKKVDSGVVGNASDFIFLSSGGIKAFDFSNGKLIWSFTPNSANPGAGRSYLFEEVIYFVSSENKLHALDIKTGKMKWEFAIGAGVLDQDIVSDNGLIFISNFDFLYALDAKTGLKKWEKSLGGKGIDGRTPNNGILYYSQNKDIVAINSLDGAVKWQYRVGVTADNILVNNNIVYIENGDFGIVAFDAITGSQKWYKSYTSSVNSELAVYRDMIIFEDYKNKLVGVDAKTGDVKWRNQNENFSNYSPTVSTNGLVFSVGFSSALNSTYALTAYDALTGEIKWSKPNYSPISPIIINDKLFAFTTNPSKLVSMDISNGSVSSQISLNRSSFILYVGGKVYLPTISGMVQ